MPSFFVTQPNGRFAMFCTIVDNFTEYDLSEADCMEWYASKQLDQATARQQWQRVTDDVIPHREDRPCCDQRPLRRWHDCLTTILHVHGTNGLYAALTEMAVGWMDAAEPIVQPEAQSKPACPSCDGSGWVAAVGESGHCWAGGPCRCVGGANWREAVRS